MRPRTLKVLYNILYEEFQGGLDSNAYNWGFICHTISHLRIESIITEIEYNKLYKHFLKQYPTTTNYKTFYDDINFNPYDTIIGKDNLEECSWFQAFNRDIRIKFLEAILDKLNK